MIVNNKRIGYFIVLFLLFAFFLINFQNSAQDIPPTEELSLGSSVFVFRGSTKSTQKKFISRGNVVPKRSKVQRAASTKRVIRQYNTLAKVVTRRERIKPIAVAELEKFLRASPKEAAVALTGAGQYYLGKEEFDKSINYYRGAADLDAANKDAILGLSDALASKGGELLENDKASDAEPFYREAITLNDKNSSAYAGLGEVLDEMDKKTEAISNYEKALELDADLSEAYTPLGILYYQQGELAKAKELLTKAVSVKIDSAETQFYLGLIKFKESSYKDALAAFDKSAKLDAESAETYYELGETYRELFEPEKAIAQFEKAKELNPKYAQAWFALGVAQYDLGKYEKAIESYSEVVKLQNTNGEAHANLGDSFRLTGDLGKSENSYRLATYFLKNDDELFSKFGYVLGAQRKWSSAVKSLQRANEISPNIIDFTNLGWAYYNWGLTDIEAGRREDGKAKIRLAKESLLSGIAINQKFAPAYLNLGVALNDLGENTAAVEALNRAVELRENWVFAIMELGLSYYELKDYDKAIVQFQKAISIDGKFDRAYYNLGQAQLLAGKTNDARKTVEKLKELKSGYAKSLEALIMGAKKQ